VKKSKATGPSDTEVIALLKRYRCPVPFHEVRTRFFGGIASPILDLSPLDTVKQLWGGEWPEFETLDAVNGLLNVLVGGLWNRLTAHQSRRNAFQLLRFDVTPTREGLMRLALVRKQEIDGLFKCLFGPEERIELPERAHVALGVLTELRAMFEGMFELLNDTSKPAEPDSLKDLMRNIQKLTFVIEAEMNDLNLSCKRARVQRLEQLSVAKPTWH
jgi:hypothetical protein